MEIPRKRIFSLCLFIGISRLLFFPDPAEARMNGWADSGDAASDARAVWVYYSNEYEHHYDSDAKVASAVRDMNLKNVDIIIASMRGEDILRLSDPDAERTRRFQFLVNEAADYDMNVYVGHWEEKFSGTSEQMAKYTRVDAVMDFNRQNKAGDADVTGIVTDYEMLGEDRHAENYDKWREFHSKLKNRIGQHDLKLIPVVNDPDTWVRDCRDCDSGWREQNRISGSGPYTGDVAFFSSYDNTTFGDALMGMYYYASPSAIQSGAQDDIAEGGRLSVPIVAGFSVGPNSADASLLNEGEVNHAVYLLEQERANHPDGVLGVMCWRWDDPEDDDDEYRDIMSARASHPFRAIRDAHVRGGTYADTNFGASAVIEAKNAPDGTGYDRLAFLAFDYSGFAGSSVRSATLYFHLSAGVTDPDVSHVPVTIRGMIADWDEHTLTWNNRPSAAGASVIGTVHVTAAGWYGIDVTGFIQNHMDVKTATFRFSDDAVTDRLVNISSKENAGNTAYLAIQ